MWGWGWHLAYPYSKTGIRGLFIYWLSGRDHSLVGRFETPNFPMLVCLFVTDFYIVNALILLLLWAVCFRHDLIALTAICGLFWAAPRYLHDVRRTDLSSWDTFKVAVVQYLANLAFTVSASIGALPHRMILLSPSVFKLEGPESPLNIATETKERSLTVRVESALSYTSADDLWIVTCYFNPLSYATRLDNYLRFKAPFARCEARFITVECAFENQPFVLPGRNVIRMRARDVMWQKERLLNLAISGLPSECRKVTWLDCDILFQNPDWLVQTSRLLDRVPLVQPFEKIVYPDKGNSFYSSDSPSFTKGFAVSFASAPTQQIVGNFEGHGHSGFAWAARREVFMKIGLYEACVAGDGDHMIAHAACGDWDNPCVVHTLVGLDHREHFREWAREFYKGAQAQIDYVPGTIIHLWHGDGRRKRFVKAQTNDFDPRIDIRIGPTGALEWNSDKPELHQAIKRYFVGRKEDG
jgi:hypothetical protein